LLLDNETGGTAFPTPVAGRKAAADRRAVLVGQVWSSDLAETLMEVYSPFLTSGYSLEDVARWGWEPSDDRSGD